MGWFLILYLATISLSFPLVSAISYTEFLYPNFTASNLRFVDSAAGTFVYSRNGTFKASIFNPGSQQIRFYLCVVHVLSNTIIWSANRDAPISNSGFVMLTVDGINITDEDGTFRWSTPKLESQVSSLQLMENGNLVLLDHSNRTIWESFAHPTDTIVSGQRLSIGKYLSSAQSRNDLSTGDYTLSLAASDATLEWKGMTYWKLSMERLGYRNSNYAVEFMTLNQTGLYLFGRNGTTAVMIVNLAESSSFRIAKLDGSGQFVIGSFNAGRDQKVDFVSPADQCRIPYVCGSLGVCLDTISSATPVCSCPSNFNVNSLNTTHCVPSNTSYSLSVACSLPNESSIVDNSSASFPHSYMRLGHGMDYFANYFTLPLKYGIDLSSCQAICSSDCSCLGIFYDASLGSCYVLEKELGSIMLRTGSSNDRLGYIKVLIHEEPRESSNDKSLGFPVVALVFIPLSGTLIIVAVGYCCWRKSKISKNLGKAKGNQLDSQPSSEELEVFSIRGLPVRFDYEEMEAATENFKTEIGSGGFGIVYKGTLPDKTPVAVKMITNFGNRGKKDFCTEIAVIGNVHHVNLVKLKGYCAQGRRWLLIYEYMNRGSLDRSLFGIGPVLEWQERVEIALGVARGLAYLHSGCQEKIVHCDIKPENILLHDLFQAKISDFGLSKLLSSEQSALFTTMRGTRGYLAPEWLTSSAISDKTDVYSYGMVVLELVSGRKNCVMPMRSHSLEDESCGHAKRSPSSPNEIVYFPSFALEMHEQKRYLELADPRLEGRVNAEDVEKLVRIALCCVHEEPKLRPNMVRIVGMLEGEIPVSEPRMISLEFLKFYGSRFAEASTIDEDDVSVQNDLFYPQAKCSNTNPDNPSDYHLSDISSQQISGPR